MRRLAVPCTVLVLLAGCGGGDQKSTGSATVRAGGTVPIRADEYAFDPGRVVVDGAGTLTIRLRNAGSLPHDIRVRRGGRDVGGTPSFEPGGTETARVSLTPGTYQFLCTVGDHAKLGMRGTLVVK
jgi:plastocyanin